MTVMDMIVDGEAQPSDTMVPGSQLCPQCQHTMEPIVDFRRPREHGPTDINRALVELVCKFKFLGVTITEDLRWSTHTNSEVRKAQVFGCSTDSILLYHLVQKLHHRLTQRGKLSASGEVSFPSFQEKHELGCSAVQHIIKDAHHPNHDLFQARENSQPGKHYKCVPSHTSRIQDSYFPPALRLLNKL